MSVESMPLSGSKMISVFSSDGSAYSFVPNEKAVLEQLTSDRNIFVSILRQHLSRIINKAMVPDDDRGPCEHSLSERLDAVERFSGIADRLIPGLADMPPGTLNRMLEEMDE